MTGPCQSKPELYRERAARMRKMADDAPNAQLRATYLWLSDDFNRRYFLEQAALVRGLVEQAELACVRALYQEMAAKLERMAHDAFDARNGDGPGASRDVTSLRIAVSL
jgi:hypothetical protein